MIRIKDLPINDRPIERLLEVGVKNLSDEELLSIILKTGTKDGSVKILASNILSVAGRIENLKNLTFEQLINIKGVGKSKAAAILSVVELGRRCNRNLDSLNNLKLVNSELVYQYFKNVIGDEKQEYFYCIYLDNHKKIIKNKLLFLGTINHSLVHPREIFKEAYLCGAVSIICVHNHPTGNITPSRQDIELTSNLVSIGKLLGIGVDDHIIIGKNNYYSFFENNRII